MTASEQAGQETGSAAPATTREKATPRPSQDAATLMGKMFAYPDTLLEFNEAAYLASFPDVQVGIDAGRFASAWAHWCSHGAAEDRLSHQGYRSRFGLAPGKGPSHSSGAHADAAFTDGVGHVLVVGWADDSQDELASVSVGSRPGFNGFGMARFRRPDVEESREVLPGDYGFVALLRTEVALAAGTTPKLLLRRKSGALTRSDCKLRPLSSAQVLERTLDHIGRGPTLAPYFANGFAAFDTGLGDTLVALSRRVTAGLVAAPIVMRHGPALRAPRASVIVCLYGRPEWLIVQNALFAATAGGAEVEYIYVCNSPELAERLDKELRISAVAYGLDQRVVLLGGNAGFAAACNVGASMARSDRLIFANPDLFPRESDWLERHEEILRGFPAAATKLFGGLLFYDDGAIMHAGMYLETDHAVVRETLRPMLRVEHHGKGFPAGSAAMARPRPVTAVSGALISVERAWFEALDGFSADYTYGHYEDADFCLRSLARGVPAWLHDWRFWHLEGKGGGSPPAAQGASLLNRWHFTRRWHAAVAAGLEGRHPDLSAGAPADAEAAA